MGIYADAVIFACHQCVDRPMWGDTPTPSAHILTLPNLHITFEEGGKTYTVFTSVSNPPEVQMEPHVCYYKPYPFITVAEDIESMDEVFYEIYSHEVGWVQVSWILGNEIRNKIKNAGF